MAGFGSINAYEFILLLFYFNIVNFKLFKLLPHDNSWASEGTQTVMYDYQNKKLSLSLDSLSLECTKIQSLQHRIQHEQSKKPFSENQCCQELIFVVIF